jgi:hypothetical protein
VTHAEQIQDGRLPPVIWVGADGALVRRRPPTPDPELVEYVEVGSRRWASVLYNTESKSGAGSYRQAYLNTNRIAGGPDRNG